MLKNGKLNASVNPTELTKQIDRNNLRRTLHYHNHFTRILSSGNKKGTTHIIKIYVVNLTFKLERKIESFGGSLSLYFCFFYVKDNKFLS